MYKLVLSLLFTLIVLTLDAQEFERYSVLPDTNIRSVALEYKKNISIMVPSEYQDDIPDQDFPLIVIFDRQNNRSYNYILKTIDYLTSNEQMPASIVIGVESNHQNRYGETQLPVNDSTTFGLLNESFIFDELIPFAQNRYNASPFTVLIGHSRYGFFTTYLLTRHFNELNAVISASPFLTELNVNLVDSVSHLQKQNISHKLYYRYGIGNDYPEDFHLMEKSLSDLRGSNKQLDIQGTLFKEAAHNATPGLTVGSALYDVFAYWSHQQNAYINNSNKRFDTLALLSENIQLHYGHEIPFSLGTLNGKGWYFYNEGDYLKAIEAWTIMLEEYPNYAEGYLYIIYAQQELNQDFSKTLEKLSDAVERSDFYTKEEEEELREEIEKLRQ